MKIKDMPFKVGDTVWQTQCQNTKEPEKVKITYLETDENGDVVNVKHTHKGNKYATGCSYINYLNGKPCFEPIKIQCLKDLIDYGTLTPDSYRGGK